MVTEVQKLCIIWTVHFPLPDGGNACLMLLCVAVRHGWAGWSPAWELADVTSSMVPASPLCPWHWWWLRMVTESCLRSLLRMQARCGIPYEECWDQRVGEWALALPLVKIHQYHVSNDLPKSQWGGVQWHYKHWKCGVCQWHAASSSRFAHMCACTLFSVLLQMLPSLTLRLKKEKVCVESVQADTWKTGPRRELEFRHQHELASTSEAEGDKKKCKGRAESFAHGGASAISWPLKGL